MVVHEPDDLSRKQTEQNGQDDVPVLGENQNPRLTRSVAKPSTTVLMFREFAAKLDDKHDRMERLIRLSRDSTIESKRVIFQLHRASSDPAALHQAAEKLHYIRERYMHKMALELDGFDKYYYVRAFTPGLQEFIEAYGFYKSLKDGTLLTYEELQNDLLTFKVHCDTGYLCGSNKFHKFSSGANRGKSLGTRGRNFGRNSSRNSYPRNAKPSNPDVSTQGQDISASVSTEIPDHQNENASDHPGPGIVAKENPAVESQASQADSANSEIGETQAETKTVTLFLPPTDFLLGLCDIPGELMRACIHAVSCGNKEYAFATCNLIQHFYACCLGIPGSRQHQNKMGTMRASIQKMEYACYRLSIRDDKVRLSEMFDEGVHGEEYDSGNE